MIPEQKFFFDLNGWILLPAVLTDAEITVMKQEVAAGAKQAYQGELQNLLDHDGIVDFLTEILAISPYPLDDAYGFRCEHSHISVRPPGWQDDADFRGTSVPHVVEPPQQANAMRYQVAGDKIFSGLTRVVWELEEVKSGSGGTTFLSGSHKAHFSYGGPDPYRQNVSDSAWEESLRAAMVGYSCPPAQSSYSPRACCTHPTPGRTRRTRAALFSTATTRSGHSGTDPILITRQSWACQLNDGRSSAGSGNLGTTASTRGRTALFENRVGSTRHASRLLISYDGQTHCAAFSCRRRMPSCRNSSRLGNPLTRVSPPSTAISWPVM